MRRPLAWRALQLRGEALHGENARIYTLPDDDIDVVVAAGGPEAAELAGRVGDGLDRRPHQIAELTQAYRRRRRCRARGTGR